MHIRHHAGKPALPTAEESRAASLAGAQARECARRKSPREELRYLEDLLVKHVIGEIQGSQEFGNHQVTVHIAAAAFPSDVKAAAALDRLSRRIRAAGYRVSTAWRRPNSLIISWWEGD